MLAADATATDVIVRWSAQCASAINTGSREFAKWGEAVLRFFTAPVSNDSCHCGGGVRSALPGVARDAALGV